MCLELALHLGNFLSGALQLQQLAVGFSIANLDSTVAEHLHVFWLRAKDPGRQSRQSRRGLTARRVVLVRFF